MLGGTVYKPWFLLIFVAESLLEGWKYIPIVCITSDIHPNASEYTIPYTTMDDFIWAISCLQTCHYRITMSSSRKFLQLKHFPLLWHVKVINDSYNHHIPCNVIMSSYHIPFGGNEKISIKKTKWMQYNYPDV